MGLIGIAYGGWVVLHFRGDLNPVPDLQAGLALVWGAGPLIFLQLLWVAILLYTGLSRVTAATLHFHVHEDRI